jgi:hypothetical protein
MIDAANILIQQFDAQSPNVKETMNQPSMFKPMKNIIERVHEEEEEDFDEGARLQKTERNSMNDY